MKIKTWKQLKDGILVGGIMVPGIAMIGTYLSKNEVLFLVYGVAALISVLSIKAIDALVERKS